MARHPTSRRLLTARRGHDLALGLDGPEPASAHPPVARRAVSPVDRSRAIRAERTNEVASGRRDRVSSLGRLVMPRSRSRLLLSWSTTIGYVPGGTSGTVNETENEQVSPPPS